LIHMSNPAYEFIKGDIRDDQLIAETLEGVDFVIHAAAVVGDPASKKYPELTSQVNYTASIDLIKRACERGIKGFVFFSTCSNYGVSDGIATEETPLNPLSLYAETKVDVEKYLNDEVKDIDWVVCRLSTVYGASYRMRFDLTVNDFAMNAYTNKYLDVFMPYTYRPYIHVFDAARTVLEMIGEFEKVKNNVFNVGFEGQNYQKIQIVEAVKKFIPELSVDIIEGSQDLRDYRVDFSKLKQYLGLKNIYTVEDGVGEVIEILKHGFIADAQSNVYSNNYPDLGEAVENRVGCP
jgi:nucleoside-diphosphate-sugar epimerase